MKDDYPGVVPDYTNAFLWSFLPLVFIALFAIWAVWGLLIAGGIGWLADKGLVRLSRG